MFIRIDPIFEDSYKNLKMKYIYIEYCILYIIV